MKVLLTGSTGQLGRSLQESIPSGVELIPLGRSLCDLNVPERLAEVVLAYQPDVLINAAAYTQVDKAETERELAFRINTEAPAALADAARQAGARLIHVSTDFVFDGAQGRPYKPDDACNPLNTYGASKRAGELAVLERLPERALVLRTAWVYSRHGGNFVKTMLRLMGSRDTVSVVSDQIGTPTWAGSLAHAVWLAVAKSDISGIYHWTDAGAASWYDFAVAIEEEGRARGLVPRQVAVTPISSAEYRAQFPTTVPRPSFSILDLSATITRFGIVPPHWRANLRRMLDELSREKSE